MRVRAGVGDETGRPKMAGKGQSPVQLRPVAERHPPFPPPHGTPPLIPPLLGTGAEAAGQATKPQAQRVQPRGAAHTSTQMRVPCAV